MNLLIMFKDGDGVIKDKVRYFVSNRELIEIKYWNDSRESISKEYIDYYKEI